MKTQIIKKTKKRNYVVIAFLIAAITLPMFSVYLNTEKVFAESPDSGVSVVNVTGSFKNAVIGDGLVKVYETDKQVLHFDNESGGIAVEDKETGYITYSNPPTALDDSRANNAAKNLLMSQLQLTYYIRQKQAEEKMNSYEHAMMLEQVTYAETDKGVRVNMTIGREQQMYLLPNQIRREDFEAIIEQLPTTRAQKQMQAFYILYTIEGQTESKSEELLREYPVLDEMDIYVIKSSATDRDKTILEDYMKSINYTYEMLEEDHAETEFNGDLLVFPSFKLSIDYILVNDSLEVILDVGSMEYDENHFYLSNIELLSYFGAGESGNEGYLFIPDGSGALINFNNEGLKNTLLTKGKVYGTDAALSPLSRGSFKHEFRMPVFGIKTEDNAIFGIIESGDAIAEINAEIGNINHSYNTVNANFVVRQSDRFVEEGAFEQQPWIQYEKTGFMGVIAMRYYFLSGENADYAGMARSYQKYLVETGQIQKLTENGDIPFYFDTYGAVVMIQRRLGIPMNTSVAVTSFEDAYKMIETLNQNNISNINLRYKGWYNGGYYYTAASKLKTESVLGGIKGLKALSEKAEKTGASVYPDVDFIYATEDKMFDGFTQRTDAVRTLFQKSGVLTELNPASFSYMYTKWCISPDLLMTYFTRFTKEYDKAGINNISLGSVGDGLHSNFKNNSYMNRQTSEEKSVELLQVANDKYDDIITDKGNAYTIPYVDHILNLPLEDSSLVITDMHVPFAQIVLHGYVSYAASPINLSSDIDYMVLKSIEYGSGAYFLLNYADSSVMRRAYIYDDIYSVHFDSWLDDVVAIYNEINSALKDVQNAAIIDHKQIQPGVYETVYENGKVFLVNYNDESITIDGKTVGASSYVSY